MYYSRLLDVLFCTYFVDWSPWTRPLESFQPIAQWFPVSLSSVVIHKSSEWVIEETPQQEGRNLQENERKNRKKSERRREVTPADGDEQH